MAAESHRNLCKMVFSLVALSFASGMIPGQALWTDFIAKQGVGRSFCPDHEKNCDRQALVVAGLMSEAQVVGMLNGVFSALLFHCKGGKYTGVVASLVMTVGWLGMAIPCWGAQHGYDAVTFCLVWPIGGLINFCGRMMVWSMYSFMGDFAGREHVLMAMASAGHQVGGLQALVMMGVAEAFNLQFFAVSAFQAAASIACCVVACVCVPSVGRTNASTKDALKQAAKIIQRDGLVHNVVACVLGVGSVWTIFYQCGAAHFGETLFKHPKAGDGLASLVVSFGVVASCLAGPILSRCIQRIGLQFFILVVCLTMWIAAYVLRIESWPAQCFVAFTCVSLWSMEPILTGSHLLAYATIARAGSVLMVYSNLLILYALISQQCALLYLAARADTSEGFAGGVRVLLVVGAALYTAYFLFITVLDRPERPLLLPQEERELCKSFGCTTFLQVVDISCTPESALLETLTDNLNEASHLAVVDQMRPDKLRYHIENMQLKDFVHFAGTQRWFWQENVSQGRSAIPLVVWAVQFERMKKRLSTAMDVKSCRKGRPNSLKTLRKQLKNAKVSIVLDENDPNKLVRRTEVVLARLSTNYEGRTYFLVERALYYPGTQTGRKTFRFPGTKKLPDETLEQAVDRIVIELGMEAWEIDINLEDLEQMEEATESASYPGLTTLYKKILVGLTVLEPPNDEIAASKGLMPKPGAWHASYSTNIFEKASQTVRHRGVSHIQWQWVLSDMVKGMLQNQSVRNKPVEMYDWLTEDAIQAEIASLNKKFYLHFPTNQLQRSSVDETKTWLLLARANVMQLSRLIGKGDVKNLAVFLRGHDVSEVALALRAMSHWSGSSFPDYHDRLCKLFSRKEMVDLISANEASKAIVVEYIVNDLIATQLRARRSNHVDESAS